MGQLSLSHVRGRDDGNKTTELDEAIERAEEMLGFMREKQTRFASHKIKIRRLKGKNGLLHHLGCTGQEDSVESMLGRRAMKAGWASEG